MKVFPVDSVVSELGSDGLPVYDRPYTSADLRNVYRAFLKDGVFLNVSTSLQVSPATGGMNVVVGAGSCLIQGAFGIEDADRTLQLQAAHATLDRIDTVVARLDLAVAARSIDLYVVQGTPAANPLRPNLTRNETVWEIGLADVYVPKAITNVTAARISDTRLEVARCGVVTPFAQLDTTTLYNQLQAATNAAVAAMQDAIDQTTAGNLQKNKMGLLNENNIPENADLNAYTTPRTYGCPSASVAASLANCPTGNAFALFVHSNGATVTQEVFDSFTGTRYVRYDTGAGSFGAWTAALDTSNTADHVVSRDVTNGWTIVKYASGRMEQRKRFTLAADSYTWQSWGTLYETSEYAGGGAYPVAFAESPSVSVGHVSYGYGSISGFEIANNGSATACPRVYPLRPSSADAGDDITFEVTAVGRWR